MEEKKSLTKAETKNLFSRLELVYGAAMRARWQDLPWTEVMGDWAARLGDFTGDSEAINYALEHLPEEIKHHFSGSNIIIIFPDQHGDAMDEMTFAQPQHTEDQSAYEAIGKWIKKKF